MFRGKLTIGNVEMESHVLNDFRRVLTQREMVRVLSPAGRESGGLRDYLQAKAFADKPLHLGAVIPFKVPGTQYVAHGYEATTLIEICEKYLEARDEGLLKGAQKKLAIQAEIVIRSCAKVGIITLIDEAMGYDKFKKKQEYQLKLQAFIADELQDWARMFPDAFWYELARLEGIHYSPRSRPLRWGQTGIEPATSSLGSWRSTSFEIRNLFEIQPVANNSNHFNVLRSLHRPHDLHGTPLLNRFSHFYGQYGEYEISCAPP